MENKFIIFGNINSIKSSFILKLIFSNLWENRKLEIIRYAKHMQKNLLVDINNYKSQLTVI